MFLSLKMSKPRRGGSRKNTPPNPSKPPLWLPERRKTLSSLICPAPSSLYIDQEVSNEGKRT
jgi:hypothetical protein